ncbi:unnamed protein product [Heligmosomoides polygyrus]|uniref:Reverse transcriptase domain-containing protein n=1 Tax=Heligmosomoides polygyrus TaxID=6339 RepID=A0A183GER7_HELPZ|nr:unnamed protein product [Heligmosomoides polygyrus]
MVKTNLLPKKRKHAQDVSFTNDVKRVKQELESVVVPRRPTLAPLTKRRAVDVLNDVLSRLQGGDRQIASMLLREFSIDHLPTLSEDVAEVVDLIITSASVTSYDQIARQLLRLLLCIMRRTDGSLWNNVLQRLLSDAGKEAKQYRRLNRMWTEVAKSARLPKSIITRLKCDLPSCPVLYVLIKTHKLPPEGATIESPSSFKLLGFIPSHLPNTNAFLQKLRAIRAGEEYVMESFDVTSLYTNVSRESALQAVSEILTERQTCVNLYGLSVSQVMTLVNECLMCNVFKWSGEYYRQIRGLAMGQRLAPVLAVAFMSKGLWLLCTIEDGLTIHTYNTVKNLVGDSHRQVRILALRILLVFANRMPTLSIVSSFSKASDTKLRLCDDAFSIACDAVNDQEVMVRTEAATILGEFQMVSDGFLDQTLDKKMMRTIQDSSGREQVKKVHQSRFAITQTPHQPTRESRWKSIHQGHQKQTPYDLQLIFR